MVHIDRFNHQIYTPEQVSQFFDRIGLPQKYRSSPVIKDKNAANTAEGLAFATVLQKYFLANVPWENLELHYSSHHTISLDPMHLFHKIVERGDGRGGYCMENTAVFGTMLASLGYDIMTTGARVNEAAQSIAANKNWKGPRYDGWNHMVTIATIAGAKYLIDVGFGSNGPTAPVPLVHNHTRIKVLPNNSEKLTHEHIPDTTHKGHEQLLWVYSYRFSDSSAWLPAYCFSEVEFLPADFATMNFFVSKSPTSWFTYRIVCLKFLMRDGSDGEEEMVGDLTLFGNELRKREMGQASEKVCEIASDEDRVAALQKYLGVRLSQPERDGIRGMITALG